MSYDKVTRCLKRHHDRREVARQLSICKCHNHTPNKPGSYKKHAALNCGVSRCMWCTNPRKIFGWLTFQELRANTVLRYEFTEA